MAIEGIAFLPPAQAVSFEPHSQRPANTDFSVWLDQQLQSVNQNLVQADNQVRALALGEVENIHQVMISLEKAKLSFELTMQIRNKLLDAYQDVMRMQI